MKKIHSAQPDNIYQLNDSSDAHKLYSKWAATYDVDLIDDMGWEGHLTVAARLAELIVDKHSAILDAGCGTGLCGEALVEQGFDNLTGIDLTEAMLAVAEAKSLYKEVRVANLTEPLQFAHGSFDGICSAGVFSHGPVLPIHLTHLIAPLKIGGISIHTINGLAYGKLNYGSVLDSLATDGIVEFLANEPINYNVKTGVPGRLVAYRKIGELAAGQSSG